jgi:hypothetical protein
VAAIRPPPGAYAAGTETLPASANLQFEASGLRKEARHVMNQQAAGKAFLIVAIMSVTFLTEVAFFALVGMF